MAERSLVVVSAGVSVPSATRLLADRLAAAATAGLAAAGVAAHVEVIEARDLAQDLTNNLLTGFPSPRLRDATARLVAADGLIAVSPIYNGSYSGLFKLFFDVLELDSLAGMPVLMGASGGTARHSLALEHALRPLFAYLGAAVVPTAVFAAAEDWGAAAGSLDADLANRIERGAGDLAAAITLERRARPPDSFDAPTPFESLLRSQG